MIYLAKESPEFYKSASAANVAAEAESFERCDTDGALSQWASAQNARINDALVSLAENNGKAVLKMLVTEDGAAVSCCPIDGRFGRCWGLKNEKGELTGDFLPYHPSRVSTLAKRGYKEVDQEVDAVVKTSSSGGYHIHVEYWAKAWLTDWSE